MLKRCAGVLLVALALHAQSARTKAPVKTSPEETQARALLNTLSLRERVAQLVIGVANGEVYSTDSEEYKRYIHWVRDLRIGGIIVNNDVEFGSARNANPYGMSVFLNQMQLVSKVPLIVGSDFERAASMRVTGGTQFPHGMAFGATGKTALYTPSGSTNAGAVRVSSGVQCSRSGLTCTS